MAATTRPGTMLAGALLTAARSVRVRIVGWVALLSALGLLGAGAAALIVERQRINARIELSLAQEIGEFSELASTGVDPATGAPFASTERLMTVALQRNVPDEHQTLVAFLPGATVVPVDGGGDLHRDAGFRIEVEAMSTPGFGTFQARAGETVRYAVMPVSDRGQRGHFVAAYFANREVSELRGAMRTYAVASLLALLAVAGAAWLVSGRVLRPVREVRRTAANITGTDVSRRIEVTGTDDVSELARTFNDMLDRLESALGRQRQMLDDAGHELRTPITIVRGHLELLDPTQPDEVRGTAALAIEELDRMNRLVEDLLLLAKARRPDFLRRERVDAAELVADVLDKALALGERNWRLDHCEPATVNADPQRMTQALLQLAANACAATKPGDQISLGCAPMPQAVRFWVRDTGPGVPVTERERIFERFHRGPDQTGEGSGLGLSLVRAIAEAHGGIAWVTSAGPTGGARFVLDIPSPEPAPAPPATDHAVSYAVAAR